jgi:hypothetical protein
MHIVVINKIIFMKQLNLLNKNFFRITVKSINTIIYYIILYIMLLKDYLKKYSTINSKFIDLYNYETTK